MPFVSSLAFHTSRLVFRAVEKTDIDVAELDAVNHDPETRLRSELTVPVPHTKANTEKFIEEIASKPLAFVTFFVREVIGFMILGGSSPGFAASHLSWFEITLKPEFTRKGYGAEALEWLFDMGFNRFNYHKSIKRKHLWQEGSWQDEVVLGLLEEEWAQWKAAKKAKEAAAAK
ncbi:putative gnat family protein [Pseudohyphozyma bogoriensis]|nr:putative gnat family protein [Pseudohyphozyma bogoriensis]